MFLTERKVGERERERERVSERERGKERELGEERTRITMKGTDYDIKDFSDREKV